jgi:predicted metal-dependent peptidase
VTETTETETTEVERALRASMARLRTRAPFFGTLAMYARFVAKDDMETAATDGLDVFYNPAFFASLPPEHLDAVIVHEVLHAALDHVHRRGARAPMRWNFAADVVVNGLIDAAGLQLPENALRSPALERFSVEEVYVALEREDRDGSEEAFDLDLVEGAEGADGADREGRGTKAGKSERPSSTGVRCCGGSSRAHQPISPRSTVDRSTVGSISKRSKARACA